MSISTKEALRVLHSALPHELFLPQDFIDDVIAVGGETGKKTQDRDSDSFRALDPLFDLAHARTADYCVDMTDSDPAPKSPCPAYVTPQFAYRWRF